MWFRSSQDEFSTLTRNSAGSRDSELTNHGFQQATRLGLHFDAIGVRFTHLFSSHLQRAAKTAGLVRQAQVTSCTGPETSNDVPEVVQLPLLMEQDFGFFEGKKWYEKPPDIRSTGKEHHRQQHKDEAGFVDMESKEAMAGRADAFLEEHLMPLFDSTGDHNVAIVSHGIMLSTLWKRLLLRLPPKSVSFSPELLSGTPRFSLEHLGGWSNTGYLELHMSGAATEKLIDVERSVSPSASASAPLDDGREDANGGIIIPKSTQAGPSDHKAEEQAAGNASGAPISVDPQQSPAKPARDWTTLITTVNGRDHLKGLKRTGGGVGSSRHDTSQKNIDSFFKRRKLE